MGNAQVFRVVLETPAGLYTVDCAANEYIWDAAARSGVDLPAICHQGRCLTCAARLTRGDVDQSAASSYYEEDHAAGFVLLCRAAPRGDVSVETHQEHAMRRHRIAHGLPAPYA